MDLGLQGKVVVITGGNAGIGRSFIPEFLAEGCRVAVCGRNEQANREVSEAYPGILAVRADVSDRSDLERLARETENAFGGIDVWINNAGVLYNAPLMDMPEDDWDATMRINLTAVFQGTRAAVPHLEKRGGGVIINASSFASVIPSANSGAYAASKAAVNELTRVFAAELAPRCIRVVAYIPGVIETAMTKGGIDGNREGMLQPLALRRFGRPEEVAATVVFLASDKAGYITGTTVEISGGKFCVQNAQAAWT